MVENRRGVHKERDRTCSRAQQSFGQEGASIPLPPMLEDNGREGAFAAGHNEVSRDPPAARAVADLCGE